MLTWTAYNTAAELVAVTPLRDSAAARVKPPSDRARAVSGNCESVWALRGDDAAVGSGRSSSSGSDDGTNWTAVYLFRNKPQALNAAPGIAASVSAALL